MTKEEIIRDEASQFAFEQVDHCADGHDGHKRFIQLTKAELSNYYDPEAKMLYLDQLKTAVSFYKQDHANRCNDTECEKDKTYCKMLFFLQQEVDELPKVLREKITSNANKTDIFISYSHRDRSYLNELKRHFKPLQDQATFWDDSKIEAGQKWKTEISQAIQKAKIAILLVSADFFNSKFIETNELPILLEKADKEGTTILMIILKPCLFEEYPQLNQYQALNSPSRPVSSLDENAREFLWVELVRQVKQLMSKDL